MPQNSDDQFSKLETKRRFTAALERALTTPPKPQAETDPKVKKAKAPKKKPSR